MVELGSWNGFNDTYCCPYFLDPSDDLFNKIGTAFLEEVRPNKRKILKIVFR